MSAGGKCEHCGATASGNFCAQCGKQLNASVDAPTVLGAAEPVAAPVQRVRKIPDPKRLAIIGVVSFFALAVLFELLKPGPQAAIPEEDTEPRFSATESVQVVGADGSSPWLLLAVNTQGLVRVDPATGEVTELGLDLTILGRSDGHVFLQTASGRVVAVDAAELAADDPVVPEPINNTQYSPIPLSFPLLSSTPDHIWLRELEGSISEVSFVSGVVRQTVSDSVLLERGIVGTSPRFTSPQAGGVYRLDEQATYRLVADGTVLAEVPGSVLVQECSDDLGCANRWLDLDSATEVEGLSAPEFRPGSLEVRPVAGSGFVASRTTERVEGGNGSTIRLDRTSVLDLSTGQEVNLQGAEIEPLWADQVDISPDADLVAAVRNLELYLRSASSGVAVLVDVRVRPGSSVVFIPR